jgi:E3 ubiquitin-protein ligase MYCBP2
LGSSKEKSKKKLSKKKKEDKEKQKKDKKTVHREGRNSLITYPNPSPYSVFSHIRHFVLQQELCDMYNIRNSQESQSDQSDDEDDKKEQSKSKTLPEIVNLGIHGVFAILSEVWQTTPSLCLRVLEEFLNILQGQAPGGLKDEPVDSTAALFDLLMKIVTNQSDLSTISLQLSSMASSCLVSLAIAVGNTSRLLTSIEALLLVPPDISQQMIKVPEIMRSLQVSVQAVLVGSPYEADWLGQGVPAKSIIDQWTLSESLTEAIDRSSSASSITSNGCFLFVHGAFGLLKVGSGYGNTVKGHVYQRNNDFFNNTAGKLMYASNSLYFVVSGQHTITVINPDTLLSQSETLELEGIVIIGIFVPYLICRYFCV